jgi:hypothetical protein
MPSRANFCESSIVAKLEHFEGEIITSQMEDVGHGSILEHKSSFSERLLGMFLNEFYTFETVFTMCWELNPDAIVFYCNKGNSASLFFFLLFFFPHLLWRFSAHYHRSIHLIRPF